MIVLGIRISFERKNYACSWTVYTKIGLATEYGKHPVRTDGGGTWYPQACKFKIGPSSFVFLFWEKYHYRKNNPIHKR